MLRKLKRNHYFIFKAQGLKQMNTKSKSKLISVQENRLTYKLTNTFRVLFDKTESGLF